MEAVMQTLLSNMSYISSVGFYIRWTIFFAEDLEKTAIYGKQQTGL